MTTMTRTAAFREIDRCTEPGTTVNEDACGHAGAFAWIIDGASGVSDTLLTPGPSDAAWLARQLDRMLAAMGQGAPEDVASELRELERAVAALFATEGTLSQDDPDHFGPSGALGLLHAAPVSGGIRLTAGFLADVVALVPGENGIERWTDERLKPLAARTLELVRKHADDRSSELPEEVRLQIAQNRTRLNKPDGYWVVHPVRPWAGNELAFAATVAEDTPIVLASDGFMRLVDVFETHDDASLYDDVLARGARTLVDELRGLEDKDRSMRLHPRAKVRDDATVLVVAPKVSQSI